MNPIDPSSQLSQGDSSLLEGSIPVVNVSLAERIWNIVKSILDFLMSVGKTVGSFIYCFGKGGWSLLQGACLGEREVLPDRKSFSEEMVPISSMRREVRGSFSPNAPISMIPEQEMQLIEEMKVFQDGRDTAELRKKLEGLDVDRSKVGAEKARLEGEASQYRILLSQYKEEAEKLTKEEGIHVNQLAAIDNELYIINLKKPTIFSTLTFLKETHKKADQAFKAHKSNTDKVRLQKTDLEKKCKDLPRSLQNNSSGPFEKICMLAAAKEDTQLLEKLKSQKTRLEEMEKENHELQLVSEEALTNYQQAEANSSVSINKATQESAAKSLERAQKKKELDLCKTARLSMEEQIQRTSMRLLLTEKELNKINGKYNDLNQKCIELSLEINRRTKIDPI
jgi:hypothetical protein